MMNAMANVFLLARHNSKTLLLIRFAVDSAKMLW